MYGVLYGAMYGDMPGAIHPRMGGCMQLRFGTYDPIHDDVWYDPIHTSGQVHSTHA
jgi:hypothetical protein